MIFNCKRCGHIEKHKGNFLKHLNRKTPCKPILEDIDIETLRQQLESNNVKTLKNDEKRMKKDEKVMKKDENTSSHTEKKYKSKKSIEIVDGKYKCFHCNKLFKDYSNLDKHLKKNCKMLVKYNNIYTFNTKTFGKNKYGTGSGDVYIVQTEFSTNNFFKVGVTTNIYNKLKDYKCRSILQPKLHYYYPFKDIQKVDKDLKELLKSYNVKREIYNCDLETLRTIIKEYQQKVNIPIIEIESELKNLCDLQKYTYSNIVSYNNSSLNKYQQQCEKDKIAELEEKLSQKDKEMELLTGYNKEQIDFMKKQIEILMKKAGHYTTNTDNSINDNSINDNSINDNKQINININGFGKEDLSYLTDRYFRDLFNIPFSAITTLVEDIHFNPKKPQNWNAKIPDDKTSKALIYNAEKEMWVKREKKEVINDMVEKSYNMLDTNFEIQKEAKTLDEKGKIKFENFMNIYDKGDKQLDKRYETEIREKLMNFKEYHQVSKIQKTCK